MRKEERKHMVGRLFYPSFYKSCLRIYKYVTRSKTFFLIFLLFCQIFLPSGMPGCCRNLDSACNLEKLQVITAICQCRQYFFNVSALSWKWANLGLSGPMRAIQCQLGPIRATQGHFGSIAANQVQSGSFVANWSQSRPIRANWGKLGQIGVNQGKLVAIKANLGNWAQLGPLWTEIWIDNVYVSPV